VVRVCVCVSERESEREKKNMERDMERWRDGVHICVVLNLNSKPQTLNPKPKP
jgi:hypothetical protein